MTPEIISKLEEVYAIGGSDGEACFYAGIGKSTLYQYQKDNPEFQERKQALQERPILKARQTIVQALSDADHAKWYLERKKKIEFSQRTEHTGAEGAAIATEVTGIDIDKIAAEVEAKLKEQKTEQ